MCKLINLICSIHLLAACLMYFINCPYTWFSNVLRFEPSSLNFGFNKLTKLLIVKVYVGRLKISKKLGSRHTSYKTCISSMNVYYLTTVHHWAIGIFTQKGMNIGYDYLGKLKICIIDPLPTYACRCLHSPVHNLQS